MVSFVPYLRLALDLYLLVVCSSIAVLGLDLVLLDLVVKLSTLRLVSPDLNE
jgi:hypothetical protein